MHVLVHVIKDTLHGQHDMLTPYTKLLLSPPMDIEITERMEL